MKYSTKKIMLLIVSSILTLANTLSYSEGCCRTAASSKVHRIITFKNNNDGMLNENRVASHHKNIYNNECARKTDYMHHNTSNSDIAMIFMYNNVQNNYAFKLDTPNADEQFSYDTIPVPVNGATSCNFYNKPRPQVSASLISVGALSKARNALALVSAGNKILIAGGQLVNEGYMPTSRVDILDIATNSWSTSELSQARYRIATAVLGNKIFFAGGLTSSGASSRVDIYDAGSNTWSTGELSLSRAFIVGVAAGNKVFFAGGSSNIVDIYDDSSGTWSTSLLPGQYDNPFLPRGMSATAIGTKVYFAGAAFVCGFCSSGFSSIINIYDIVTNTWSTSDLSTARGFMASIAAGNKNYWAGGTVAGGVIQSTSQVEIRDANTGLSSFDCLSQPNAYFSAVLKDNKIVYFPDGTEYYFDDYNKFDIYDIATGTWSIGVLPVNVSWNQSPEFGPSTVSVNNNIYVAGGNVNHVLSDQLWKLEIQTPPSVTGGGLTYKYYEGDFNMLPDFDTLTPVNTGNSPNVDISVRPAGVDDHFAFVWDGTITIPTTGTYTFETMSDDGSKLYFNGSILVNNDGLHAPTSATGTVTIAAGTYPISIRFFEKDGGESLQVYWSGPSIPRQLIPDSAFGSGTNLPPAFNGLNYKYYEGNFSSLPDFSILAPVKKGTSANVDINVRPSGVDDHFAFIWQGYIYLPAAGTYTFETISDDGSEIYFNTTFSPNSIVLVNNDGIHAPTSATGTVTVASAGAYPITVTYFEKEGGQIMQLYWSGPGFSRQPVPDTAFVSPPTDSGLNYKYYEGDFHALPDFTNITPVKTGTTNNVDISIRPSGVNDHFAFMWYGYINLPSAGTYTLETISDDGSKVYFNMPYSLNGSSIVNNDGIHAPNSASGTVTVPSAGKYPITITFFEKDGGETMQLYWTGPGFDRQPVPDAAFTTDANSTTVMSTMAGNLSNLTKEGVETLAMPKVYPNPFIESFTIDYYNTSNVKNKVSIGVYDLNGKLIYNYEPSNFITGNNRWIINLGTKLSAGVYMAQVKINGVPVKTIKLLKTKK